MFVLSVYSGSGGQELETPLKTKKNTKNYDKPPKPLYKPRKTTKTHHYQTISQNPEFVVFLGFYSGFSGQELETTIKSKKNNHQKPQQTTKTTVKTKKNHKNRWFVVVFGGFSSGFGSQELETTVETKKNHQKPRQTTKTTVQTKKNHKNPPLSNYLSKSRIRGFSWFLQWFWWSRARNHYKIKEKQPPETTTNHQNHCKNQEKPQKPVVFGGFSWFL